MAKAKEVFEREFLSLRGKLIEVAAALDRVARAEGSVDDDPRMEQVRRSLELLASQTPAARPRRTDPDALLAALRSPVARGIRAAVGRGVPSPGQGLSARIYTNKDRPIMYFFDPHIHIASRTTDDLETLAKMGCLVVGEPAFWAGFDRSGVEQLLRLLPPAHRVGAEARRPSTASSTTAGSASTPRRPRTSPSPAK